MLLIGKGVRCEKWQKIPKSKLAGMGVRILHANYVLVFLQGTLPYPPAGGLSPL